MPSVLPSQAQNLLQKFGIISKNHGKQVITTVVFNFLNLEAFNIVASIIAKSKKHELL